MAARVLIYLRHRDQIHRAQTPCRRQGIDRKFRMDLSNPTAQVDDSAGSIGWPIEYHRTAAAQQLAPHVGLERDGSRPGTVSRKHADKKTLLQSGCYGKCVLRFLFLCLGYWYLYSFGLPVCFVFPARVSAPELES
jgi:hypothetical protein